MNGLGEETNLIDALLAEQRELTAVERFAQKQSGTTGHALSHRYQSLIPLSRPGPGQQYSFEVNLDQCSGCKACVSACHSLNGLEENETWRDVGTLVGYRRGRPWQQTVTTACHHCAEPGCLEGCPVMAYEKDPATGIVRHLDDQCIGCQYCTMKCPYDVPKYSARLGIVRKCDMCQDRLAAGEAPACVQACPHEAISIRLVAVAEVNAQAAQPGAALLPGAFPSAYTKPTTRFHSAGPVPADAVSADPDSVRADHAHWPLLVMLVLTQMAAGGFLLLGVAAVADPDRFTRWAFPVSTAGFVLLNAGLSAAVFHLGRPLGAWRFFLGLRTSWMSREILAFGVFAGMAALSVAAAWFVPGSRGIAVATALTGLVAVFTSVMIYVDTRRPFWALRATAVRFYGTTVGLGAAGVAAWQPDPMVTAIAAGTVFLVWVWEFSRYRVARRDRNSAWHRPARVVKELVPAWGPARGLLVGISLGGLALAATWPAAGLIAVAAALAGAVLERYAFFVAVDAPRMPGVPR
jgi:Fe-S-cluster-containing dehydrogenase component/DMSO reductase anchor subunit